MVVGPRLSFHTSRFYNVDEATTAVCAEVVRGGGVLYRDVVDTRPPVSSALYALLFQLRGAVDMAALHVCLTATVALVGAMIFLITWRAFGLTAAFLSGILYSIGSFNYGSWDVVAFHTEWLMIAFTCGAAGLLLLAWRKGADPRCAAGAGALSALGALSKQPALLDGLACLAALAAAWVWAPDFGLDRRRARACFAGYLAAFGLVAALCAAYFGTHGSLDEFWFYVWTYNVRYHVGIVPLPQRLLSMITNPMQADTYLNDNILLLLLEAAFLYRCLKALRPPIVPAEGLRRLEYAFLALWGLAAYLGASLSGRSLGWGHYFFQVLPPFCIGGGSVLAASVKGFAEGFSRAGGVTGIRVGALYGGVQDLATGSVAVGLFGMMAVANMGEMPPRAADPRLFPWVYPPSSIAKRARVPDTLTPESDQLYRYLRAYHRPDETMFVWGFNAEHYLRSGFAPASRFIYCNHLTGLIPWVNRDPSIDTTDQIVPGSWDTLMEDLERSKPLFILDLSKGATAYRKYPIEKFPRLYTYLQDHYIREREDLHSAMYVYKRRPVI